LNPIRNNLRDNIPSTTVVLRPAGRQRPSLRTATGFSLVEVMVAMVIGMLGIIVMLQTFGVFEAQKRSTTGGDDAISSGAVTLYGLQRDMQQSGWGFNSVQLVGCTVSGVLAGGAALPLVPVTINPAAITGADANTDTLLIVAGNGNGTVEGDIIDSAPAANSYQVQFTWQSYTPQQPGPPIIPGDRVVAVPQVRPNPCNLASTTVTGAVQPNVTVAAGFAGIGANDRLFNLGLRPTVRAYAVRNQNLTVCDYVLNDCGAAANNGDPAIWVPIANNVVSLRAQYGRDTTDAPPPPLVLARMDGTVDVWDQARLWDQAPWVAGSVSADAAKDTAACALLRVSAVRVVLAARSSQPERTADWPALTQRVTPAVPQWSGSDATAQAIDAAAAAAVAIALPNPDPNWPTWQDFRCKVFQTVVPLRNVSTQGVVPEC
jgi:type IV pilus assembly protein PilW